MIPMIFPRLFCTTMISGTFYCHTKRFPKEKHERRPIDERVVRGYAFVSFVTYKKNIIYLNHFVETGFFMDCQQCALALSDEG